MNPKPKPHHPAAMTAEEMRRSGMKPSRSALFNTSVASGSSSSIAKISLSENSAFEETTTTTHDTTHLTRIQIGQSVSSSTQCEAKISTNPSSSQDQYDRTLKVAKKEYSDHGSHGVILKSSLLKKMTTSLQDVYNDSSTTTTTTINTLDNSSSNIYVENHNISNNASSIRSTNTCNETKLSSPPLPPPPLVSSSNGNNGNGTGKKRIPPTRDVISPTFPSKPQSSTSASNNILGSGNNNVIPHPKPQVQKQKTSLLHAALQEENAKYHDHTHPTSINNNINNSSSGTGVTTPPAEVQNKCLTNPMEPTCNEGLDNIEGNLIVYENDYIQVSNGNIHLHQPYHHHSTPSRNDGKSSSRNKSKSKESYTHPNPSGTTTYQVISMLGQGTFAQVFKCKNLDTGRLCALKIVKNKPAYTRQAAIEIEIFIALSKETTQNGGIGIQLHNNEAENAEDYMVSLLSYFLYQSHLCLVFELLGLNLYELLKRRQFRGLPIHIVRDLIKEAIHGTNHLCQKNIVHCDLKPENILLISDDCVKKMLDGKSCDHDTKKTVTVDSYLNQGFLNKDGVPSSTNKTSTDNNITRHIKLIDFGSACFEGQATHTYIQSRFYRSPEVLIGLDYDFAIDMWSLGCVAAELFLGLPILPGVHEHDQLGRICEMIGKIPDWMVEQGKKSKKYFVLEEIKPRNARLNIIQTKEFATSTWRLKTRDEFIKNLSEEEKKRCGGQSKLEQPSANRYFKKKRLEDIVMLHGNCSTAAERESLLLFVHFLKGILHPDPCERWTAFQASTHPFITGRTFRSRKSDEINMGKGKVKITDGIYWSVPWDPSVCRRILSFKQNQKSGRSNLHKSLESHKEDGQSNKIDNRASQLVSPTSRVTDMTGSLSISMDQYHETQTPPAPMNRRRNFRPQPQTVYQTPTNSYQLSNSMVNETTPSHYGQTQSSLSMSLHTPITLNLEPPPVMTDHVVDHNMVDHMVIPRMPVTIGAQSFSGVFHDGGGVTHALQGDFGYALQRPGVVPTGAGVGHLTQMPINQQIYMQPQPPQPPQQPQFLSPSSYHSHTADMTRYAMSGSYTGGSLPNHLMGPLSPPQNHHHMAISLEHLPQDGAYSYGTRPIPQSVPYPPNLQNYSGGIRHNRRRSYEDREYY